MPRFYVSIADANRILDTGQECLTLEHAKKLAVQTAEEMARKNKEYSHLRGKYVQVTDERGNLVYKVSLPDGMPVSRKLNAAYRRAHEQFCSRFDGPSDPS
jgi:hypothetical protein